jgi:hypothetical protein
LEIELSFLANELHFLPKQVQLFFRGGVPPTEASRRPADEKGQMMTDELMKYG